MVDLQQRLQLLAMEAGRRGQPRDMSHPEVNQVPLEVLCQVFYRKYHVVEKFVKSCKFYLHVRISMFCLLVKPLQEPPWHQVALL